MDRSDDDHDGKCQHAQKGGSQVDVPCRDNRPQPGPEYPVIYLAAWGLVVLLQRALIKASTPSHDALSKMVLVGF